MVCVDTKSLAHTSRAHPHSPSVHRLRAPGAECAKSQPAESRSTLPITASFSRSLTQQWAWYVVSSQSESPERPNQQCPEKCGGSDVAA